MHSSWTELVCVGSRKESSATIAVHVCTLRVNEKESRVFDTLLSLYLSVKGRKLHGEPCRPADHRHDQPTSRHDQPTRPADHRHDQPTTDTTSRPADTERMEKGMKTECKGNAKGKKSRNASGMRGECNRKSKGARARAKG